MVDSFARMRQLVGTTAEWAANDIVLKEGEIAVERIGVGDVRAKCGNGTLKWSELPYLSGTAMAVDAQVAAASAHAATATTQAGISTTKASEALASANAAAASYDSFDDRYLGAKATAPTLDNDGNALLVGAIYWNTASAQMFVWSGSAWINYESTSVAAAATATTQAGIATTQAGTATTQAGIATSQATTATTQAGLAATAKTAAEVARDAATATGKVFANTTDGLANSSGTGATNRYFSVPSTSAQESLILYRNDGGTAVEVKRYSSAAQVAAALGSALLARSTIVLTPSIRPEATFYRKRDTGVNGRGQAQASGTIQETSLLSDFDSGNGMFLAFANAAIQIAFHGDSITTGTPGVIETYPTRIVRSLYSGRGIKANYRVRGVAGQGFNYVWSGSGVSVNLTDDAPVTIDPTISSSKTNYLIVFAGTNDYKLGAKTPAQIRTYFQTYIAARIAAGWVATNICVCTMLPRETVSETDRTTINSNFVSDAVTYGYKVAALHSNALIGAAGQQNNTTYFSDTIHLTDAGQAIAATIIEGVLFP